MNGNHYTAEVNRFGHVTIKRLADNASVYLQGDDAIEFCTEYARFLGWNYDGESIVYPSGPFQTEAEHIDACLDQYDGVMEVTE